MALLLVAGPWLDGTTGPAAAPSMTGLQILLTGWLPVGLIATIVSASKRLLPPNPLVFMLRCGLFGLGLSAAAAMAGGHGDQRAGDLQATGGQALRSTARPAPALSCRPRRFGASCAAMRHA
jgi:hypothetical protein